MKILIIGGSGFIGSHVADVLAKYNYKVTIFDIKKPSTLLKNQKFVKGDISNIKKLTTSIKKNKIVFNFAAIADIDEAKTKPNKTLEINIKGTLNLLNICSKYKIKRFIQASSIYADSHEGGFYAISKRASEDYIQEYKKIFGLNYTILRFGSLYGERAGPTNGIQTILNNAKYKKKIVYRGSKKARRKYINVKDAALACLEVLKTKYKNKCLTIVGKKTIRISSIFKFLSNNLDIKKITFLNEKNTSHYDIKPSQYKIRKSEVLTIKNHENFFNYIKKLIELK